MGVPEYIRKSLGQGLIEGRFHMGAFGIDAEIIRQLRLITDLNEDMVPISAKENFPIQEYINEKKTVTLKLRNNLKKLCSNKRISEEIDGSTQAKVFINDQEPSTCVGVDDLQNLYTSDECKSDLVEEDDCNLNGIKGNHDMDDKIDDKKNANINDLHSVTNKFMQGKHKIEDEANNCMGTLKSVDEKNAKSNETQHSSRSNSSDETGIRLPKSMDTDKPTTTSNGKKVQIYLTLQLCRLIIT